MLQIPRILTIDDSEVWHRNVAALLRTRSQEVIIEAVDTLRKAREQLVKFKPHVIFLDWDLGGDDHGIDLLPDLVRLSQEDRFFKEFPLIVHLSANISPDDTGFDEQVHRRGMVKLYQESLLQFEGQSYTVRKEIWHRPTVQTNLLNWLFSKRPEISRLRTFGLDSVHKFRSDLLAYIRFGDNRFFEFRNVHDDGQKSGTHNASEPFPTLCSWLQFQPEKPILEQPGLFVVSKRGTLVNLAHVATLTLEPDIDGNEKVHARFQNKTIEAIVFVNSKKDAVVHALEKIKSAGYWPHINHLAWPRT